MLGLYSSFAEFIFAYQGQSVYLEIIREMRDRSHFRRTLYLATAAMVLVYVAVVAVGYATLGRAAPAFLPAAMPPGPLRTAAGLLLAFHTAVSYLVTAQPLHRAYHRLLAPCRGRSWQGKIDRRHFARARGRPGGCGSKSREEGGEGRAECDEGDQAAGDGGRGRRGQAASRAQEEPRQDRMSAGRSGGGWYHHVSSRLKKFLREPVASPPSITPISPPRRRTAPR